MTREDRRLQEVVLVGGGHSHLGVLQRFGDDPLPGVRLTLICTDTHTPYSGMLPGYVAGHYAYDEVHVDLRTLAQAVGARFFLDEVVGMERKEQRVVCRRRPPVRYDRLSINVGATPSLRDIVAGAENVLPVKPVRDFNERWLALLDRLGRDDGPATIAVVGAGAGGVELTLAMQYRLQRERAARGHRSDELSFHLFSATSEILPTHNRRVRRCLERVLAQRGVIVHRSAAVTVAAPGQLCTCTGETLLADEIVWATQATGGVWLRDSGLAVDDEGFVVVGETLQTVADPLIFAAGDCAVLGHARLAKAGVFAVRQGPILAENLRRSLAGQTLRTYRPQGRWLALISTGDRYAIASRGTIFAEGAWVWRWKDWIDRRFMARHQGRWRPTVASSKRSHDESACRVEPPEGSSVRPPPPAGDEECARRLVGGSAPMALPLGKERLSVTDFVPAFLDDLWLFGRIAAQHGLTQAFLRGMEPRAATAVLIVPPALRDESTTMRSDLFAGLVAALDAVGCTCVDRQEEGSRLALALTIEGWVDADLSATAAEGPARAGDVLILTQAVGSHRLLAAHAELRAKGRWIDHALQSMLPSNRLAVRCLRTYAATACVRLGDSGVLGAVREITGPARVGAEIHLSAVPLLEGVAECGMGACDFPSPRRSKVRDAGNDRPAAGRREHSLLLLDPQTGGGLLATIPVEQAPACIEALRAQAYCSAAQIGRIVPSGDGRATIRVHE